MVSRRSIVVLVILALTAGSHVNAQVRPLGAVGQKGEVRQASCYSDCGPMDCGGNCGTVWGATCMDPCNYHPGLYAPCPNPCRTTLVGELLLDVKHAVCTSLSHIFCCTFGNCGLATCGRCGPCIESYDCCSGCDSCVGGTYVDGCAGCGTTTSDCGCQGGSMQVSPLEVGQPAPAGVNPQNNPFRDDPNPQGTGAMGVQQTTRTRSILPAPRAATQRPTRTRGPTCQPPGSGRGPGSPDQTICRTSLDVQRHAGAATAFLTAASHHIAESERGGATAGSASVRRGIGPPISGRALVF